MKSIQIRAYQPQDWPALCTVHDEARRQELRLAGLDEAFLPLPVAAEREGLFEYPHLDVAVHDGRPVGFCAYTGEELAWLYVAPPQHRPRPGRQCPAAGACPLLHRGAERQRACAAAVREFRLCGEQAGVRPDAGQRELCRAGLGNEPQPLTRSDQTENAPPRRRGTARWMRAAPAPGRGCCFQKNFAAACNQTGAEGHKQGERGETIERSEHNPFF